MKALTREELAELRGRLERLAPGGYPGTCGGCAGELPNHATHCPFYDLYTLHVTKALVPLLAMAERSLNAADERDRWRQRYETASQWLDETAEALAGDDVESDCFHADEVRRIIDERDEARAEVERLREATNTGPFHAWHSAEQRNLRLRGRLNRARAEVERLEAEVRSLARFRDLRRRHNEEMEQRTAECAVLRSEHDDALRQCEALRETIRDRDEETAEARANLRKYGRHTETCAFNINYGGRGVCTCGFDVARGES